MKEYYRRFIRGHETQVKIINNSSAQCFWTGKYQAPWWSPRGAMNYSARWDVSGLAGVKSVLRRQISAIYSTDNQIKVDNRRSLNSVMEPDYLG